MSWEEFYKGRVNSASYAFYFEKRYEAFLSHLKHYILEVASNIQMVVVKEEGVGIGSVTKHIAEELRFDSDRIKYLGFDISDEMLALAKQNCYNGIAAYRDDIINPQIAASAHVIHTHGVLEHFTDEEFIAIAKRHQKECLVSVNYLPLDKYMVPSFGDERLLPPMYWSSLLSEAGIEHEWFTFNAGHDLCLTIKGEKELL